MSIDAGDDGDRRPGRSARDVLSAEAHAELEQLVDEATAGWLDETPDELLIAVIGAATEEGVTDGLGGGVTPDDVQAALPEAHELSQSRVKARLRDLADEGALERVEGIDPETLRPRSSYKPPHSPDASK